MLPLGRIGLRAERGEPRDDRLTPAERVTLMTLWAIARSPLMIGGDLPSTDPDVIRLFTNADVLEMHATATASRELFRESGLVLWSADGARGTRWVGVFNLEDSPRSVVLDAQNVGLPVSGDGRRLGRVTELWTGREVTATAVTAQRDGTRGVAPGSVALALALEAHGAALLRFDEAAG
jgi:alpha-galactosidase